MLSSQRLKLAGANGDEVPPVPIPNTEVKLISAEDTWRVTAWENRAVPAQLKSNANKRGPHPLFLHIYSEFPKGNERVGGVVTTPQPLIKHNIIYCSLAQSGFFVSASGGR